MMDEPQTGAANTPVAEAGLVDCMFVVERTLEGDWVFRNAGCQLPVLLGRDLVDHNLLSFWTGYDRNLIDALLSASHAARRPGFIAACGETIVGKRVDVEIVAAPLMTQRVNDSRVRILGLYQVLGDPRTLQSRPIWRHRLTRVTPPAADTEEPGLRLIVQND